MARSQNEIRDLLEKAITDRLGTDKWAYIVDIYPDHLIFESADRYYQCTFAIVDDAVTLGEATEVERKVEYEPIRAEGAIMAAKSGDSSGFKWDVRVAAFGIDLNGNYWDRDVLTAALVKFEGAKVFMLDEAQHQEKAHRFGKPVGNMVGVLQGAMAKPDGIYATLILLPTSTWLRDNLVGCQELGLQNVLGLSVDVKGKLGSTMQAGRKCLVMTSINNVTVDVVYDPVAKGEFLRMAAARQSSQREEAPMIKTLLAGLARRNKAEADRIQAALDIQSITTDQAIEQVFAAVETVSGETLQAANDTLQEIRLMGCSTTLETMLTASKLPDKAQDAIRKQFDKKVFDKQDLQAAICASKELVDSLTASGTSNGAGDIRIVAGRESVDKLQAAFDGMLNVEIPSDLRSVPVFTSLRAAYVEMTGDTDITGVLNNTQLRRMQAAYGNTTFAEALGNTMYRRVTQDYRVAGDYGVSRLVGNNIRNAVDFRPLQSIHIGYTGDLPTVDTNTDDYPELTEVSEEAIEYALLEQGGIITINRKMIINDDLRVIQKILSRLPRGARRGVARKVWTPFITNAVYKGDNKAIFHIDHNNLGTTAYGITSALAATTAMFNQQEPGTTDVLGLSPVTVAYPAALHGIVKNVNDFNPQAVAIADGNSMYGYFKPEGLFKNPFMTDATDWMMFADPSECEIVELAFLNGQQEPLMLVADNPANGQMFVGGRIQYKIMHDYNAEVMDFRGAYKGVVAG